MITSEADLLRRLMCLIFIGVLGFTLAACGAARGDGAVAPAASLSEETRAEHLVAVEPSAQAKSPCALPTIVAPTPPALIPGYTELDPATGLHVTGKMPEIDFAAWRLRISGQVERPLELTYDEIRCLPRMKESLPLVCPGFFEDFSTWAGAPIRDVLALAGIKPGARSVEFVSADGYSVNMPLERALEPANFLAYEWQDQPLPRLHGFPLRVVIPDGGGSQWVKWLVEVRVR